MKAFETRVARQKFYLFYRWIHVQTGDGGGGDGAAAAFVVVTGGSTSLRLRAAVLVHGPTPDLSP